MSPSKPTRRSVRRRRSTLLAALAVVGVAILGVPGFRSLAGSPASGASGTPSLDSGSVAVPPPDGAHADPAGGSAGQTHAQEQTPPQGDPHDARAVAEGEVPDGVTVFDTDYPGVANLDPALL